MAERRMFAKSIVTSDLFLDMPMSARCLYFTFGMFADDDGFVNSPKSIMRQIGASVDDFNILLAKKYIICFDSGVIVIKHWKVNNYLQKDRYRRTAYVAECNLLEVDEKGVYSLKSERCIHSVYKSYTQDRIGKDISHESHACACEEKAENGGLAAFLTAHPTIKNDLASEIPRNIDWAALGRAIAESEWLQQCTSLRWLIENYDKIISGAYKTFKAGKTQHFAAEREYTADELNKLYKNVDDIDF